jgi:ribonucleoside-diphosphate reductase alpha chain
VHYFDSLAAMQAGIVALLSTRFPVGEPLKEPTRPCPPCPICGHISVRNGACYKCINCGESIGCS